MNKQRKKTYHVQEKNGSKLKMFRRLKLFDILPDLIQPLSQGVGGGRVGFKRGSREKKIVFSNQSDK